MSAKRTMWIITAVVMGTGVPYHPAIRAAQAAEPSTANSPVTALANEAAKLEPLVHTAPARVLLAAAKHLPIPTPRVIYVDHDRKQAYTEEEFAKLDAVGRENVERKELDAHFYYYTRYGSPLVYARPLDLVVDAGLGDFAGKRILDFGYGGIGHLRLLASCGADVVGIEVDPVLRALYSQPGDQGIIEGPDHTTGRLLLVHGSFPSDRAVREAVGDGYDLVISKNVLKRGYIHPERKVEERLTIKLGVDDATFVRALYDVLKPGGWLLIYNLSPAQNPPDEPYIPWADGRCPFAREVLEAAGFEVLADDADDASAAHDIWFALGYDEGQSREALRASLFAHYTLLRKQPTDGNLEMP